MSDATSPARATTEASLYAASTAQAPSACTAACESGGNEASTYTHSMGCTRRGIATSAARGIRRFSAGFARAKQQAKP